MRIILIPPHLKPHEQAIVWTLLEARGLEPVPLSECPKEALSTEQFDVLCACADEKAPIPPYQPDQRYVMVELRSKHPGARRFLEDALGSTVEGTSRIPVWEGGRKRYRPVRQHGHPLAFLREIIIVFPDENTCGNIHHFFVNNEEARAA